MSCCTHHAKRLRRLPSYYLAWSTVARTAIKDGRLLRKLGFLRRKTQAPDGGDSADGADTETADHFGAEAPGGLNGTILLLHLHSERPLDQRFSSHIDDLIGFLQGSGYELVSGMTLSANAEPHTGDAESDRGVAR